MLNIMTAPIKPFKLTYRTDGQETAVTENLATNTIRALAHSKLFDDYFLVVDTTILIVVPIVGSERTTRLVCCILLK